jgi:hypothetical protein
MRGLRQLTWRNPIPILVLVRGEIRTMKIVVVGGHSRNVGKTSVVACLIRGLAPLNWVAVKISPHRHGADPPSGEMVSRERPAPSYFLAEESDAAGQGDTSRYLAAGARRAWWLSYQDDHFAEACGHLFTALHGAEHVIIESNRILEVVRPSVYLMVLDSSQPDFKASAERTINRADALVLIGQQWRADTWSMFTSNLLERKPMFPVRALGEASPDLCGFVSDKLQEPGVDDAFSGLSNFSRLKEQTWRH